MPMRGQTARDRHRCRGMHFGGSTCMLLLRLLSQFVPVACLEIAILEASGTRRQNG